jgi:PTS system nitrogen regulatory IIA component
MKLTLKQLAGCLDLPPGTIQRWVVQGRIPVHMIEHECIFNPSTLERWAVGHNLRFVSPGAQPQIPVLPLVENLVSAMEHGGVYYDIDAGSVHTALRAAVDRLTQVPKAARPELLLRLLEREALASTGVGNGIALPHPRSPLPDEHLTAMIATFFLKKPIDFNALDDRPVFVLFVLLCPSVRQHLHLLSRLSFCIRSDSFIHFLKSAPSRDLLLRQIAERETELDQPDI